MDRIIFKGGPEHDKSYTVEEILNNRHIAESIPWEGYVSGQETPSGTEWTWDAPAEDPDVSRIQSGSGLAWGTRSTIRSTAWRDFRVGDRFRPKGHPILERCHLEFVTLNTNFVSGKQWIQSFGGLPNYAAWQMITPESASKLTSSKKV